MHEVKVFDSTGRLKKVISPQTLNIRSKQQMETPSMFRRNKKVECHGQNLLKIKQKPIHNNFNFWRSYFSGNRLSESGRTSVKRFKAPT